MLTLWPLARSNSGTSSISASLQEIVLNTTISAPCALPVSRLMPITPAAAAAAIPEKCILASRAVNAQGSPSMPRSLAGSAVLLQRKTAVQGVVSHSVAAIEHDLRAVLTHEPRALACAASRVASTAQPQPVPPGSFAMLMH